MMKTSNWRRILTKLITIFLITIALGVSVSHFVPLVPIAHAQDENGNGDDNGNGGDNGDDNGDNGDNGNGNGNGNGQNGGGPQTSSDYWESKQYPLLIKMYNAIVKITNASVQTAGYMIYRASTSIYQHVGQVMAANSSYSVSDPTVEQTVNTSIDQSTAEYFKDDSSKQSNGNGSTGNGNGSDDIISQLPFGESSGNGGDNKLAAFNFNTLIGPTVYKEDQSEQALRFIRLLSGNNTGSKQNVNNADLMKYANQVPRVKEYLEDVGAYGAIRTVALSNLYRIYAERMPEEDNNLREVAGIPDTVESGGPISQLAVDKYMAEKRAGDPTWYQKMNTASPTTLQRETLYVLVEMRYEMFRQRLELERINATMSAIALEAMHFMDPVLKGMNQDIQKYTSKSGSSSSDNGGNGNGSDLSDISDQLNGLNGIGNGTDIGNGSGTDNGTDTGNGIDTSNGSGTGNGSGNGSTDDSAITIDQSASTSGQMSGGGEMPAPPSIDDLDLSVDDVPTPPSIDDLDLGGGDIPSPPGADDLDLGGGGIPSPPGT